MSIFDLQAAVLQDYKDFVQSFFTVAEDRLADAGVRSLRRGR